MYFLRKHFVILCLCIFTTPAQALTASDAQQCANELLTIYVNRNSSHTQDVNPLPYLDLERLARSALGTNSQRMTEAEHSFVREIAAELILTEFRESERYEFSDPETTQVRNLNNGVMSVEGTVFIVDNDIGRSFSASFQALLNPGVICQIRQVRIADIATLSGSLRDLLREDPRTAHFFRE